MRRRVQFVVVLSMMAANVLLPVSGDQDTFMAWGQAGEAVNLLEIFHGGAQDTPLSEDEEVDPGAFTAGSPTGDPTTPYDFQLMKLQINVPSNVPGCESDGPYPVKLEIPENVVKLLDENEGETDKREFAENTTVLVKATQPSTQLRDIEITATAEGCEAIVPDDVYATAVVVDLNIARMNGETVTQDKEETQGSIVQLVPEENPDDIYLHVPDLQVEPVSLAESLTLTLKKVGPGTSQGKIRIYKDDVLVMDEDDEELPITADDLSSVTTWKLDSTMGGVVDLALIAEETSSGKEVARDTIRVSSIPCVPNDGEIVFVNPEASGSEIPFDDFEKNAASSITEALTAAKYYCNILVARNTYSETNINVPSYVLISGLAGTFDNVLSPYQQTDFLFSDLPVVRGTLSGRIFTIHQKSDVHICGLTIQNGYVRLDLSQEEDGWLGGGMLVSDSDSIEICYTHFNNNLATWGGGGIAVVRPGDSNITIRASLFTQNRSDGDDGGGGALVKDGLQQTVHFEGCVFGGKNGDGNFAGAQNARRFRVVQVDQNIVEQILSIVDIISETDIGMLKPEMVPGEQQSRNGGGGISVIDARVEVANSEFSYNVATYGGYGGGCAVSTEREEIDGYKQMSQLDLQDVVIRHNTAQGGAGLGIMPWGRCKAGNAQTFGLDVRSGAKATVVNCTIEENVIQQGGSANRVFGGAGILVAGDASYLQVIGGSISKNIIHDSPPVSAIYDPGEHGDGAAVNVIDQALADFKNVKITDNETEADDAGGFAICLSTVTMEGGSVSGNSASGNGGGFHMTTGGSIYIENMWIGGEKEKEGNTATHGGGLNIRNSQARLVDSWISFNKATGQEEGGGGVHVRTHSTHNRTFLFAILLGRFVAEVETMLTADNTQFLHNEAENGWGGGGHVHRSYTGEDELFSIRSMAFAAPFVALNTCTFSGNRSGKPVFDNFQADGFLFGRESKGIISGTTFKEHEHVAIMVHDVVFMHDQGTGSVTPVSVSPEKRIGPLQLDITDVTFLDNRAGIVTNGETGALRVQQSNFEASSDAHVVIRDFLFPMKLREPSNLSFLMNDFASPDNTPAAFIYSNNTSLDVNCVDAHNNNLGGFLAPRWGVRVLNPIGMTGMKKLDFSQNWWGNSSGPTYPGFPGTGSQVSDGVDFSYPLETPVSLP